uniref:G-protein coupled receptors family 1 profile domain-containing protein n=1 Tax=Romanomermis culicivorax TaxID=13658 RepID=A0A915I390_ROMCU
MEATGIILLCFLFVGGSIGLFLNGGLLFVNLANRNFHNPEYCLFIYCLAFSNVIYTIEELTIHPWLILTGAASDSFACKTGGFLFMAGGMSSVFCQTFLSLNRFLLLRYEAINDIAFSRNMSAIYVILIVITSLAINSAYIFLGDLGLYDGLCLVDIRRTPLWHPLVVSMIPVLACYGLEIYCAWRVSWFIHSCAHVTSRMVKRRIEEGRSIIKLIVLEISIPIILEMPATTMMIVCHLTDKLPPSVTALCCGLYIAHATADPISLVYVIKPYRKQFLKWYKRNFKKASVHGDVTTKNSSSAYQTRSKL